MNEKERKAVEFLREKTRDLLTPKYNTDFNLLRWAIGHGYDMDEALFELTRHLKLRRFHNLDEAPSRPVHEILQKYFPLGIIGDAMKEDNTLLVAECAGRIDLKGILKSVQLSDFLLQRYAFQPSTKRVEERVIEQLNAIEARTGRQASVVYLLDLDGLKFDSWLLNVVTGPYRILWTAVYTNYPEWISQMVVVNCPTFMSLVWKAILPLLPERTRSKLVHPSRLPSRWGGDLVNHKAVDAVTAQHEPIPSSLYWKPDARTPAAADLESVTIPPGKNVYITYTIKTSEPFLFVINRTECRFCDRTFGMSLFYHPSFDESVETSDMQDWLPYFDFPGMPTVDRLEEKAPGQGTFRLHFSNQQAWIRSLPINFRVLFEDESGNEIAFTQHKMIMS